MFLGEFDGIHRSSMGDGSILYRNYDWIGATLAADEYSSDKSIFGRGVSMSADDGYSTSGTDSLEDLFKGDATKWFFSLAGMPRISCSLMRVEMRACK